MLQKSIVIFLLFMYPVFLHAQFSNYWSYNFNEESSLVAGAVVGGGAGASAIFYNPAIISEIKASKLSLNASLFAYDVNKSENMLGEGIDLHSTRFYPIPRSLSYMYKPKNHAKWSLEFSYLNVANTESDATNFTEKYIDILTYLPGIERYVAYTEMNSKSRNDFYGAGGSYKLSENFYLGVSMFVSVDTKYSNYKIDISATPTEMSILSEGNEIPYYIASQATQEMVKFNDYRLLGKFGILFKQPRFSIGVNITTPSLGGIYSDGKKVLRKHGQSNITNPKTGEPMRNFLFIDYAEKKKVSVNSKSPFSIAAGFTHNSLDNKRVLYTTVEYFSAIDMYQMVNADVNSNLTEGTIGQDKDPSDWLTFTADAKPVINAAIGYRWQLKKDLMLLSGFKTDFNYKKEGDYSLGNPDKSIKSINVDYYHISSGLTLRIKGQDITAGIQYSLGLNKNAKQFVNYSDPVEFNFVEYRALQGTRTNTAKTVNNSFTLLLAAAFNFNGKNK